jgi:hypothetical protein
LRPSPSGLLRTPDRQIYNAKLAKEHRTEDRKLEAAKLAQQFKARQKSNDHDRDHER